MSVQESNVFNPGVRDVVFYTWVLADGAHRYAVGTVAPKVLDENIGGVGFGRETVVADIDAGVGHCKAIDVERVEPVGILGKGLI